MKDYIIIDNKENKITVSDVHKRLLPLIKEIDRVCNINNIEYILDGGSALGAIRHSGFIPWDDDFDIVMTREQYDLFIKALDKDLDSKYHYQCYKTHKEYNILLPEMKIRIKDTYLKEKNILLNHNCKDGDGLFVDIFVIDYINENKFIDLINRLLNVILMPLLVLLQVIGFKSIWLKNIMQNHAINYGIRNINSKYMGHTLTWTFRSPFNPLVFKKDKCFPATKVIFEDTSLPVAKDYDYFLTKMFGPNYMSMPPIHMQKPKHIIDIKL